MVKNLIKLLMILVFFMSHLCVAAEASRNDYVSELITKSRSLHLYENDEWLALLHYHYSLFGKLHSQARSNNFFLSKQGRFNSEHEMTATLSGLFSVNSDDEAIQCRFPLRYQWLKNALDIDDRMLPHHACLHFSQWKKKIKPESVTMVFPSANMGAPSSLFGHTLLRINSKDDTNAYLLSHSVSYAAIIPKGTAETHYVFGSIKGSFPGRFLIAPYYQKIKEYGQIENRDIWEYSLNLNKREIDRLLMHLWEIKDVDFEYYFSDENCAYRLLELLEIARPESNLTRRFPLYVIPTDTIRAVVAEKFVRQVKYRPSMVTQLQANIDQLNTKEKNISLAIAHDRKVIQSKTFLSLSDKQKSRVLQTTLRYTEWKQYRDWSSSNSHDLTQAVGKSPAITPPYIKPPVRPDQGHLPLRFKIVEGTERKPYSQIGIRPVYHDLTDNARGYVAGSELSFLNTEIRITGQKVRLQQFDFLTIASLRPVNKFMMPLSWELGLGAERTSVHSGSHLISQVHGNAGLSFTFLPDGLISILPGIRIEYHPNLSQYRGIKVGASIGYLLQKDWGSIYAKWGYNYSIDSSRAYNRFTLKQNFSIGQNQAFRLGLQYKEKFNTDNLNIWLGYVLYL